MDTDVVVAEDAEPGVRVITLQRPDRLNAVTSELIESLHHRLDDIEAGLPSVVSAAAASRDDATCFRPRSRTLMTGTPR